MSRGCELRQISKEDAQLFLLYPEKLLELEKARYEAYKHKGWTKEVIDPTRQFYDWRVLTALVSGSAAWTLLVKCGQQVGETEQMWKWLDADARILSIRQVRTLNAALTKLLAEEDEQTLIDLAMLEDENNHLFARRAITVKPEEWTIGSIELEEHCITWPMRWQKPEVEIQLELYWIKQQLQQFVQEAAEAEKALLILA